MQGAKFVPRRRRSTMPPAEPGPAATEPGQAGATAPGAQRPGASTDRSAPRPAGGVARRAAGGGAQAVATVRPAPPAPHAVASAAVRGPTRVRERLYLGGYAQAADPHLIATLGITHVVNVTVQYDNLFAPRLTYLKIPVEDRTSERLGGFFAAVAEFIGAAHRGGGTVLVHCQHGVSRSATVMLAYLMATERLGLGDAFAQLRALRPEVEPNPTFWRELRQLEETLAADGAGTGDAAAGRTATARAVTADAGRDASAVLAARLEDVAAAGAAGLGGAGAATGRSGFIDAVAAVPPARRAEAVAGAVRAVFVQFGGSAARDTAAHAAVATALRATVAAGALDRAELLQALATGRAGPAWDDLLVDVPLAASRADALAQAVRAPSGTVPDVDAPPPRVR